MRWHSVQRYERSSISEQQAGHFIKWSPRDIVEIPLRNREPILSPVQFESDFSPRVALQRPDQILPNQLAVNADSTPARNASSSTGLRKKADAPVFIALERTDGSSLLVRTTTRLDGETSRSRD